MVLREFVSGRWVCIRAVQVIEPLEHLDVPKRFESECVPHGRTSAKPDNFGVAAFVDGKGKVTAGRRCAFGRDVVQHKRDNV